MVADSSIYSLLKPIAPGPSPMEQYGQAMQLKALLEDRDLKALQRQQLQRGIADEELLRAAEIESGGDPKKLREALSRLGLYKPRAAIDKDTLDADEKRAKIDETKAKTGEILAGRLAGAMGALSKGGGSDESVNAAYEMLAQVVGPDRARSAIAPLLNLPPEKRLQYAIQNAGTHKVGQDALKIFFPEASIQDTGGQIVPVSKSTLPGGPAAGSVIPGAAPIAKTATPGELLTDTRTRAEGAANRGVTIRGQNLADARALQTEARERDVDLIRRRAEAQATGTTTGRETAEAALALPQAISTAERGIRLIDEMIGTLGKELKPGEKEVAPHKGFRGVVGATILPGARFVPGTDASDFDARLNEIKGGAFLQAFESLKGGGQITQIEGDKATQAITRMERSQSEREFVAAAREFQDIVRKGLQRAKTKASANRPAQTPNGGIRFLGFEGE